MRLEVSGEAIGAHMNHRCKSKGHKNGNDARSVDVRDNDKDKNKDGGGQNDDDDDDAYGGGDSQHPCNDGTFSDYLPGQSNIDLSSRWGAAFASVTLDCECKMHLPCATAPPTTVTAAPTPKPTAQARAAPRASWLW